MLIDDATFIVTDTETTGLRPGPHRVIEIGAVKVEAGQITDSFSRLVNPGCSIPNHITRLTGITTPAVFAAPSAAEVLPDYLQFLGDGVFVGHNAAFDRKFIQFEVHKAGIDFRIASALCTKRLARRILHALPSKSLSSLMRHYGITARRRHRALDDARATAEVLIRLIRALTNETQIRTVDELLRFQNTRHERHVTPPAHVRRIRSNVLATLPEIPGVYLFKDGRDRLLYVGKARNIRARVRTYFVGINTHPVRIRLLVRAVRNIDFIPTASELSALILESRLIKSYQPRFNRAEVRYRNLPFLRVDNSNLSPSVTWSYEINPDGADYFGPLKGRREAEYLTRIVRRHPSVLSEDILHVATKIEDEMRSAAAQLDFERAGRLRDEAEFLRDFSARPYRTGLSVLDHNAVWIERSDDRDDCTVFAIRLGRLAADCTFKMPPSDEDIAEIRALVSRSLDETPSEALPYRKKEIDEIRVIANWLYRSRDNLEVVPWDGQSIDDFVELVVAATRSV